MMDLSEIRKRAWKTRRKKYGQRGHAGTYSRHDCCRCAEMRAMLIKLHNEGVVSEGQVSKATGLGRIQVRYLADTERNHNER